MKKRLRKKLHKGEFKELGFNLEFYYTGDYKANEEFFFQFFDRYDKFLSNLNIECIGGIGDYFSGFVTYIGRGTVTPEQRQNVIDWLEKQPEVTNITAGPLRDVWYDGD